jgi:hypothetical protein
MRSFLAPLFLAATFALAGCGSAAVETESTDVQQTGEALSSVGQSLVGSFTKVSGPVSLSELTFKANGAYEGKQIVQCFAAPCDPIPTAGTWRASGSFLSLTPAGGSTTVYTLTVARGAQSFSIRTTDARRQTSTFNRVAEPETCGGIGALQCPDGKSCVYEGPSYPDQAGKCYPRGARGTMCGGLKAFGCDPGLTCIITDTYPDASGICRAPGDEGTACGGIGGLRCATGLTCVITETGHSDPMGVCTR